jgi:NADPH-ferrihemoprotein reductase
MENATNPEMPLTAAVAVSGCLTVVLASVLAYALRTRKETNAEPVADTPDEFQFDKSTYPGGVVSVYYATQTGTAESFARTIEREGAKHGFYIHVVDLEDVQVEDLLQKKDMTSGTARAVVLSATYGEGEAPDNATVFVQSLCEKASTEILFEKLESPNKEIAEPSCLSGVDYCVFGLANRQYDNFNSMGKLFDHALNRVGAKRILALGTGDDDDDLENDFETWKDTHLWPTLKKKYLADVSVLKQRPAANGAIAALPDCQYAVEYHKNSPAAKKDLALGEIHSQSRHYFTAVDCPVTAVRELRSKEDTDSTVHVEVDISMAKDFKYETADNLGVLPVNDDEIVESVANSLAFDLDQVFSLSAAPKHEWHGSPFPNPISVRECLTRYCDLTAPPRRSELKLLAAYAKDPMDQKALLRMASKEGRVEYREKIVDEYFGLVDILKLCPSIKMPLEHFLSLCPFLQTRFFTISSSSSVHPNTIHLTVAVTSAKRKDGTLFKGVCSNYLASRKPSIDRIRVYNRPSAFRLPKDSSCPIIMIGPGTGVAPMRALLQERAYQRTHLKQTVGRNILYFGCKNKAQDFLYQAEFEEFQKDGLLDKLRLAFSRETREKVYVQHLLMQDGDETWKLVEQEGAHIYVCGGVKMGQDVAETLNKIVASHGDLSHDEAKDYLAKMSSQGRFVQELWA